MNVLQIHYDSAKQDKQFRRTTLIDFYFWVEVNCRVKSSGQIDVDIRDSGMRVTRLIIRQVTIALFVNVLLVPWHRVGDKPHLSTSRWNCPIQAVTPNSIHQSVLNWGSNSRTTPSVKTPFVVLVTRRTGRVNLLPFC